MSEEAQNASKTLAPLVTATEPTTLTTAETDTPVSPEMPTVTASNPPSRLSSIAEDKATASASTNPTESASRDASEEGPTKEEVSETSAAAEPQAGQSTPDNQSAEVKSVPESSISEDNDEYLSSKEETSGESVSASPAKPRTSIPPPVLTDTTSATSPATLDSLLSPTETEGKFSIRESVAASDVTDDETRFSTVLLSSARQSLNLTPGPKVSVASSDLVSVDEGTGSDEITLVDDWRKHKKTASNSTILSVSNVPYLISQLDEGAGADSRSRPNSMGGKIREEFYQKQPAGEVRDYTAEGEVVVDWGAWCYHLSRRDLHVTALVLRFLGTSDEWYITRLTFVSSTVPERCTRA